MQWSSVLGILITWHSYQMAELNYSDLRQFERPHDSVLLSLSTKSKSPKSVKSRDNRDIKVGNARVEIKLRCFRQSRGTFSCQKVKMSLDGVFPCAWSEMCNSLIKHSDPDDTKPMGAVSGCGIQGNKRQPGQQSGLGGAARGGQGAPASSVRAGWGWQRAGGNESGHTGLGAAAGTPQGCQDKCPQIPAVWGQAELGHSWGVWMVPVETALHGEVPTGLILTRNCKG